MGPCTDGGGGAEVPYDTCQISEMAMPHFSVINKWQCPLSNFRNNHVTMLLRPPLVSIRAHFSC